MSERADIVIVGGGVIGSAIAFFLRHMDPEVSVIVLERAPDYREASSALSLSSIRQQFSTPLNIEMSRYGMGFLKTAAAHLAIGNDAPALGLVERGYLYLATEEGRGVLEANHAMQRAQGCDVVLLERNQLAREFPWLETRGLAAASLGRSGEGWFDGYALLQAFRRKARVLGAEYRSAEAVSFDLAGGRIRRVNLAGGGDIACGTVVNAAGPHARDVAAMAGVDLPVFPEKRCVFVFECKAPPPDCPLVIDPSGVYFRPDGSVFLAGGPVSAEPLAGLEVDHTLFEDAIWPVLAARVPAFEALRVTSAWAGYYEMNAFDHNAILGPCPQVPNLLFANGFSGHGMQHAPAAGRGIAERILHGAYRTLDLSALGYERLARNAPVRELNVI